MNTYAIKERVYEHYSQGFHCAESIAKAILEARGTEEDKSAIRAASGFCGGIGRCKEDVCGALSGGILALGQLYGRNKGGEDIDPLCECAKKYRSAFLDRFGSTNCGKLLEKISEDPELENCRDLTAEAALLLELIIAKSVSKQ